jgi:hypothetical protein
MGKAVRHLYDSGSPAFDEYAIGFPEQLWDGAGAFAAALLPILREIVDNGSVDDTAAESIIVGVLGDPPFEDDDDAAPITGDADE